VYKGTDSLGRDIVDLCGAGSVYTPEDGAADTATAAATAGDEAPAKPARAVYQNDEFGEPPEAPPRRGSNAPVYKGADGPAPELEPEEPDRRMTDNVRPVYKGAEDEPEPEPELEPEPERRMTGNSQPVYKGTDELAEPASDSTKALAYAFSQPTTVVRETQAKEKGYAHARAALVDVGLASPVREVPPCLPLQLNCSLRALWFVLHVDNRQPQQK
jgi:hypothetical protein